LNNALTSIPIENAAETVVLSNLGTVLGSYSGFHFDRPFHTESSGRQNASEAKLVAQVWRPGDDHRRKFREDQGCQFEIDDERIWIILELMMMESGLQLC